MIPESGICQEHRWLWPQNQNQKDIEDPLPLSPSLLSLPLPRRGPACQLPRPLCSWLLVPAEACRLPHLFLTAHHWFGTEGPEPLGSQGHRANCSEEGAQERGRGPRQAPDTDSRRAGRLWCLSAVQNSQAGCCSPPGEQRPFLLCRQTSSGSGAQPRRRRNGERWGGWWQHSCLRACNCVQVLSVT